MPDIVPQRRTEMKKFTLLLIIVFVAFAFAGCSAQGDTNKAPSVVGVKDVQCIVNTTVDFLDGVAALDKEDGDITPQLSITVTPKVDVTPDGFATFTQAGEYTVDYSVADSNGRTAQKRAYVDVVDRDDYRTFEMPEDWSVNAYGSAKVTECGMTDGAFVLQADGGEISEDVQLQRTFRLNGESYVTRNYTFRIDVKSDAAGKIAVLANGEPCSEQYVVNGNNTVVFTYGMPASDSDICSVTVALCFGALGKVNLQIGDTRVEYPQQAGAQVELTPDFNFDSMVSPRIDAVNSPGLEGNAWAMEGGTGARLEITKAGENNIWAGGMFVNTGVQLKPDTTYKVSFNVERHSFPLREEGTPDDPADFEVIIQRSQWGELQLAKFTNPENGVLTAEVSVDGSNAGPLWIYVQSATQCNQITISDLHVVETLTDAGADTFAITDFTVFNTDAHAHTFHSNRGGFTYFMEGFSDRDSDHAVTSPTFFIDGSGANYVITFKAKASAPIEMVVAGPVADGWDPTLMWAKVVLSEQETVYTFTCNGGKAADKLYKLVWQFGSANNQQYSDVTVEIYDIRVCLRNVELDG